MISKNGSTSLIAVFVHGSDCDVASTDETVDILEGYPVLSVVLSDLMLLLCAASVSASAIDEAISKKSQEHDHQEQSKHYPRQRPR